MLRNKREKRSIGDTPGEPQPFPFLIFISPWSFLANLKANVSTKLVLPLENATSPKE